RHCRTAVPGPLPRRRREAGGTRQGPQGSTTTMSHPKLTCWLLGLAVLLGPCRSIQAQDSAPDTPPANAPVAAPELVPSPPPIVEMPAHEPAPLPDNGNALSGPFGNSFGPMFGLAVPRVDYRAAWFPAERVEGQATDLGYWQQDLSASAPIWHDGPDLFALSAHVRGEFFHTDAMLPDTRQPFPDE